MDTNKFELILKEYENDASKEINRADFSNEQLTRIFMAEVAAMAKEHKAIKISLSAEGYYSGNTYDEEVILLTEDFLKYVYGKVELIDIDDDEFDTTIIISELDGKYSEVTGYVSIQYLKDFEMSDSNIHKYLNDQWDGSRLHDYLFSYNDELGDKCKDNLRKYMSKIDYYVNVTVKIKESQRQLLDDFIKKLNES